MDKTAFLADLISSDPLVWFLSRPRRFGKSLTVSTLEAIFSGQKELFKGLAIEERLDEERFVPRPVINLDMSRVSTFKGVEELDRSLARVTTEVGKKLGVELTEVTTEVIDGVAVQVEKKIPSNEILFKLIEKCAENANSQVAVLIDERDKPYLSFTQHPEEMKGAREILRDYYTQPY